MKELQFRVQAAARSEQHRENAKMKTVILLAITSSKRHVLLTANSVGIKICRFPLARAVTSDREMARRRNV